MPRWCYRRSGRRAGVPLFLLAAVLAGACSGSEAAQKPSDERFGHRYEDASSPSGRETVMVAPPDTNQAYFYYPAVYDTLHIRPAPFDPKASAETQAMPVEVLVKGAFPNTCTELSGVDQERVGHLINVRLQMRKPRGAVCAAVERPYRFYLMLPGTYRPGSYTLTLNDEAHPFVVRASGEDAR